MLGGPTKVNVIEPSHANVKSHAKNSFYVHCYCKTTSKRSKDEEELPARVYRITLSNSQDYKVMFWT